MPGETILQVNQTIEANIEHCGCKFLTGEIGAGVISPDTLPDNSLYNSPHTEV